PHADGTCEPRSRRFDLGRTCPWLVFGRDLPRREPSAAVTERIEVQDVQSFTAERSLHLVSVGRQRETRIESAKRCGRATREDALPTGPGSMARAAGSLLDRRRHTD